MSDTTTDTVRLAQKLFDDGFNCAESVLLALAGRLEVASPLLPRIASGFGGGMARTQSTCGALAGGVMGIGLKFGRMSASEDRAQIYGKTAALIAAFKGRFHSHICRELTGIDFADPQEFAAHYPRVHHEICSPIVAFAVEQALAILLA